jgi:aminopeptidase N
MSNPAQFHAADGSGYAFWVEYVLTLDACNPYLAALLARTLERWRAFIPALQTQMHAALLKVQRHTRSHNVREIVDAALNDF